jgi:hypothetical protein
VTDPRLDQAHELLESQQAIVEDDLALTVDRRQAQHSDRASCARSYEVLDLPDTIPRETDARSSTAGAFEVLVRYDEPARRPPTGPGHEPQDRRDQQGRRHQQTIDATPGSPPEDHRTCHDHTRARHQLGPSPRTRRRERQWRHDPIAVPVAIAQVGVLRSHSSPARSGRPSGHWSTRHAVAALLRCGRTAAASTFSPGAPNRSVDTSHSPAAPEGRTAKSRGLVSQCSP